MIGRLTGLLAVKRAPQILVDCNGVGYEVDVSMTTYYQLPEVGEQVSVWTHLQIKDDAHTLIGFTTEPERKLFRQLIRINGVGSKMALTILSGISFEEFTRCVMDDDAKALTALPGVGKKTAERLIIELRDKIGKELDAVLPSAMGGHPISKQAASPVSDAVSALVSLGYKAQEASRMVRGIETEGLSTEDIIRESLQGMVK